jgi:hypothetical protein
MKATEFIRKFGLEKARNEVALHGWLNTGFWIQLKRYVEAYELVNSYGGLKHAKEWMQKDVADEYWDDECERREQAIQLVEEVNNA